MKAALTLLIIVALGLGAALWFQDHTGGTRLQLAETALLRWSNQWFQSQETLDVTAQTSARYNSTILLRDTQINLTSNELVWATNALAECGKLVGEMQTELEGASKELWERDTQLIAEKKHRKQAEQNLEKQTTNLKERETQLAELSAQLKTVTTNRMQLEKQIKALQTQLDQANTNLVTSKGRVTEQDRILSALNLERELMITRAEQLEQERAQLLTQWTNRTAVEAQLQKLSQ